jgi:serine/threonine protein kinase
VLIYEMLVGSPPFCADNYHSIMRGKYPRPPSHKVQAENIISLLLVQAHTERLGAGRTGHREVQSHAFFDGVDWDALEARRLPMPWVPEIGADTDTSMFDEYDEAGDTSCDKYNEQEAEKTWYMNLAPSNKSSEAEPVGTTKAT